VPQIARVMAVLTILSDYGRHLSRTLEQRAIAHSFATIARFFGTIGLDTIQAHITRGLMRTIALEQMLRQRIRRGLDLPIQAPRTRSCRAPPAQDAAESGQTGGSVPPEVLTPEQEAAAQAAARKAGERLARRIARNAPLTLATMPRMKTIEAEVRRSPVGRTIAAICRDFGISPALCNGVFWSALYDVIRHHRGSSSGLVRAMKRNELRFDKEEWKHPGLELPEETRDGVHRVLGFFVGEKPFDLFAGGSRPGLRVAAAATGPP
jgi:hypothetical protein